MAAFSVAVVSWTSDWIGGGFYCEFYWSVNSNLGRHFRLLNAYFFSKSSILISLVKKRYSSFVTAFCGRIVFYFSPLLQKFKHIWLQSSVFWSVKWFTSVYRFVFVLFRAKLMRLYLLLAAITTSSRTFQAQSSVSFNGHKLGTKSLKKCDKFDEFHRALIRTTTHQVQVWWQESLSRSGEWANKSFVTLLLFEAVLLFAIAERVQLVSDFLLCAFSTKRFRGRTVDIVPLSAFQCIDHWLFSLIVAVDCVIECCA